MDKKIIWQLTFAGADRKWSGRFLDNVAINDVRQDLGLHNGFGRLLGGRVGGSWGSSRRGLRSKDGPCEEGLGGWSWGHQGGWATEVGGPEVGHGRVDLLGEHGRATVRQQGLCLDGSHGGGGEGGGHLVERRLDRDRGHGDHHGLSDDGGGCGALIGDDWMIVGGRGGGGGDERS